MSQNSSGDKLMQLRKKYGVKQYQLAGENISRSYIGMVEQNRRKITRNKAEEITKNFNILLKGKDIEIKLEDFYVEAEEEMSSRAEQIVKKIKEKDYGECFLNELRELEGEIIQNTIQNKATIYFEIGEKLFTESDFVTAAFYFEKSLEYFLTNKQVKEMFEIAKKLSACYLQIRRYSELSMLYYRLKPFMMKFKSENKKEILLNFARGFKELGEYKESIKLLDEINSEGKTFANQLAAFELLAENYYCLNRLSEAEFYYEKIANKSTGVEHVKALLNLLELKKNQNIPRRELKKVYLKIRKILNNPDVTIAENELYGAAKLAEYIDEKEDAISYLKRGLEISSNSEISEKIINFKINLYSDIGEKSIQHIETHFIDMLTKEYSTKLVASLSRFYLQNDMHEENQKFIDKVYLKLNNLD